MTSTCAECGKTIHLAQTGESEYYWLTDANKRVTRHCGLELQFPFKTHAPAQSEVLDGHR